MYKQVHTHTSSHNHSHTSPFPKNQHTQRNNRKHNNQTSDQFQHQLQQEEHVQSTDVDHAFATSTSNQLPTMSSQELHKLTQTIKTLVLKNKLNSKNAFNVPLIDVSALHAVDGPDDNSWNKISSVLENSSKVYGFRVDFIVDCVNKITNYMSRSEKQREREKMLGDVIIKDITKQQYNIKSSLMENQSNLYVSNQSSNNIFEDELSQILEKNLERDKINLCEGAGTRQDMNPFDKKIRRMFDQTGISGLMLAKLDISPHLHVIIDQSIHYPNKDLVKIDMEDTPIDLEQMMSRHCGSCRLNQIGRQLRIYEQIQMFRQYCIKVKQKVKAEQDCYNVQFQHQQQYQAQICLSSTMNNDDGQINIDNKDADGQFSFGEFLHAPNQDDNGIANSDGHDDCANMLTNINSIVNANTSNIIGNSRDWTINNFNIIIQPYAQPKMNKNTRAGQKKQRNRKKNNIKVKVQSQIDFSITDHMNQTDVICAIKQQGIKADRKRKSHKQRNLLYRLIPDFNIQIQTNYMPIPDNSLAHNNSANTATWNQNGSINHQMQTFINNSQSNDSCITFMAQQRAGLNNSTNPNTLLSPLTNTYTNLNSNINIQPNINIKTIKNQLWQMIRNKSTIPLLTLHTQFQQQNVTETSQAIIFLAVLHLCNEKFLQLRETGQYEVTVYNHRMDCEQ